MEHALAVAGLYVTVHIGAVVVALIAFRVSWNRSARRHRTSV